jgi:hypothetical protein
MGVAGKGNGLTPALIPAFSPREKENCSPVSGNVVRWRLADACRAIRKLATAVPSPWGEGQGEGGRETKFTAPAKRAGSKLVLALGIEELVGAVVVGFRHEDLGGAAQIAVVRRGGVHKRLRGGNAMFLQHHHEHLGVNHRAGVKQFHAGNLTADVRNHQLQRSYSIQPSVDAQRLRWVNE